MGHDERIFSSPPPESHICSLCLDVFKDAVSMKECGHTFCEACATTCLQTKNCHLCRGNVTNWNPNFPTREIIEALDVHCSHGKSHEETVQANRRRRGNDGEIILVDKCNWMGPLKDLKNHEDSCIFKIVSCPRDDCNHECCKKDMHAHLLIHQFDVTKQTIKANHERQLKEMSEKMNETIMKKGSEMQSIKADYERQITEVRKKMNKTVKKKDNEIQSIKADHERQISEVSKKYNEAKKDVENYKRQLQEINVQVNEMNANVRMLLLTWADHEGRQVD